jgi:nucleotide-binding universal stress UspA family protein
MSRFRTIVVAVDFSDASPDALDGALALAAGNPDSRLHLLHVAPDPVPPIWMDELPPPDLHATEQAQVDAAREQLASLAVSRALDPGGVTAAVAVGPAADEIVRYARDHGADVVVLGSHGHGLVRRVLLGGVADTIVRQAPCAVLLVPHRRLGADGDAPPTPPSTLPALP